MPSSFADYEPQYLSGSKAKHMSVLPKSQQRLAPPAGFTTSPSTSSPTSRTTTSSSVHSHRPSTSQGIPSIKEAASRAAGLTPSADVAEWAHQMHMVQGRSYWWCQGCFPKDVGDALEVPKAITGGALTGRRKRVLNIQNEPSHCYDI